MKPIWNVLFYKLSPTWLFLFLSRHREPLDGQTRTTLPSGRLAWTNLPAGLAACPSSTPRWDWTPFCLRTRCLYCAKNTETSRDSNLEPQRALFCKGVELSLVSPRVGREQGGGALEPSARERAGQEEVDGGGGVVLNEVLLSKYVLTYHCACLIHIICFNTTAGGIFFGRD